MRAHCGKRHRPFKRRSVSRSVRRNNLSKSDCGDNEDIEPRGHNKRYNTLKSHAIVRRLLGMSRQTDHIVSLSRRSFLSTGSAMAGLGCISGCSTNPATGQDSVTGFYSLGDDIKLGQAEYPNLIRAFGGAYDSIRLQSYVARLGP